MRLFNAGVWTIAATLTVFSTSVEAQPGQRPGPRPGGGRPGPDEILERFDRDGDGQVARGETPGFLADRLQRADGDEDGRVSREELEAFFAAFGDRGRAAESQAEGSSRPGPRGDRGPREAAGPPERRRDSDTRRMSPQGQPHPRGPQSHGPRRQPSDAGAPPERMRRGNGDERRHAGPPARGRRPDDRAERGGDRPHGRRPSGKSPGNRFVGPPSRDGVRLPHGVHGAPQMAERGHFPGRPAGPPAWRGSESHGHRRSEGPPSAQRGPHQGPPAASVRPPFAGRKPPFAGPRPPFAAADRGSHRRGRPGPPPWVRGRDHDRPSDLAGRGGHGRGPRPEAGRSSGRDDDGPRRRRRLPAEDQGRRGRPQGPREDANRA